MNKILFLPLLYSRGRFSSSGVEIARYIYVYDGQGNIFRSIDIFAQKEYTYVYEEGRIVRATESAIALSDHVARYSYDAWGKVLSITDKDGNPISPLSAHIANINPYRYRGYYYDEETKLYYLQSRYYDASVGRFLCVDEIQNLTSFRGVLFSDLFGYCINNPIIFYDKQGEYPILAGAGLQVSLAVSFGGFSISAGFELIYFWTRNFSTRYSSRFLLYFFLEPLNFNFASLKNAININYYYRKMSFNPKKLISKPKFNAAVSILTLWIDHKTSINYRDYEGRFDTWTLAGWGYRTFKSWSSKFTVIGAGKYWGISGSGITRSVSNYWKVCDIGNSPIFTCTNYCELA